MPSSAPLLTCRGLTVGYQGQALLPPIDLEVWPGEFWAVVGRNGSGKSTWFKTVLGLLPAVSGTVQRADGLQVAYVGQRLHFDALYPVTVREVVAMGRMQGTSFLRRGTDAVVLQRALDAVGASSLGPRSFRSLSEGQKQRVLLARMVASGAQLAVLDEPTAAMDAVAERDAMELIDDLRRRYEMAVLVVSHHLAQPRRLADRALFLDPDGQRVVVGTPEQVFADDAFRDRYGTEEVERVHAPATPDRGPGP